MDSVPILIHCSDSSGRGWHSAQAGAASYVTADNSFCRTRSYTGVGQILIRGWHACRIGKVTASCLQPRHGYVTATIERGNRMAELNSTRAALFANRLVRMGLWTLYLDDDRVLWSPELETVFGLEPGSFGGSQAAFRALVNPVDLPRLEKAMHDSIASREEYCVIFRYRHGSGEWRWMEGRGLPVYDESGKAERIEGVGIDVTDRTMAEHARFRLAAIVESSDDAILSK